MLHSPLVRIDSNGAHVVRLGDTQARDAGEVNAGPDKALFERLPKPEGGARSLQLFFWLFPEQQLHGDVTNSVLDRDTSAPPEAHLLIGFLSLKR